MKKWFAIFILLLAALPVFAADTPAPLPPQQPVTANKVEGPVTGQLPDKIVLTVENQRNVRPTVSDMDSLSISFCTEVTVMENVWVKGAYVPQPRTYCRTPDRKLHLTGRRQNIGIHIVPETAGGWRWNSDYSLTFKPKKPWPTGANYQVQFDNAIFPEPVKLTNGSYSFATAPLTAHISEMKFFQDPNDVEKRGVSTSISFNTPVDAQAVKEHLEFTLEELTDEPKPGERKVTAKAENLPFDVTMDERGRQAVVTTPVKILPDKERFLKAVIKPGLMAKSGGAPLAIGKPGELEERVRIPSRYDYASIEKIEAQIVKNERYVPEQVLVIQSNVPMTADELTKHLKIVQLPKDRPAELAGGAVKKDYAWTSANEITDELLKKSPAIQFTVSPTAEPYSTLHSIKLDTEPRRWLYVRVSKGLATKGDYVLSDDHNDTVLVPEFPKEVEILSDGGLLSVSGEKKISVYSLGASKLRFEVKRVMNDDIAHLVSQTRGSFESPAFNNYSFTERNISEQFSEDMPLPSDDLRKPQFSAFDFTPYLTKNPDDKDWLFKEKPKGKGLFFLTIQALAKDAKGNENVVSTDHRFVLVSDLGLVVKTNGNGSHDAFVQSIKTGKPVSSAEIDVLGVNGLSVIKVNADSEGHAIIPNLQGLTNDKQPVAYVVRNGDDLAFMSYERRDRALDYSQFDTDGMHTPENQLRAFLFSDRGIYRPGEDIHVGMVVKQGDWAKNLEDVPLQMEVTNPRGQVIDKPIIKMNATGLAEYSFSTKDTSPTGVYNVRLYISANGTKGNQLGSTAVRVEEFLPDTLKILSEFNKPMPKGWLTPDDLKASVTLQHLYGAPAVDHRVKASLNVMPGSFSFKEFADYQFFDALKAEKSFDQPISEAQTNAEGKAVFDLNLGQFGNSTYRLTFEAEGFAQDSGRSVHTVNSVLVSPLPYVVGMKTDGNLEYINKDEKRALQLIAVDSSLTPIEAKDLKLQVAQVTYVSSLIKNERGAYEYRSIPKESIAASGKLTIPAKGLSYTLDSAKPGSYVLILSNERGQVIHRISYTIVGEGNLLGRARKDAALSVKLDKQKYEAEAAIKMNIISPYTGTGLITLETDKVLAFKWFQTTTTSSVQTINIPKGFTGKGFVNVQFVRSLDSREIYTTPLAYNVEPFFVSTASIDSQIKLTVPEKAKPGETLTIHYQTKTPGKIIIYAVDEGILQYAHYQTPDPLSYFVNRRALQVGTSQILDLLMPEYSIMQELSAPGGDTAAAAPTAKNLNPFKRKTQPPVAFWSGVIDADETEREMTYQIPEYFNGNLRVMAVSVSDKTIGAAESKTFVQGDIIVSPNVPTFAAPGDEFTIGMSIANNIAGSGKNAKLKLVVTPSEQLEIIDGKESEIVVPEGGESKAQVRAKAKDVLGGASLTFTVFASNKSVKYEATLSVRPPLPNMTALVSGYAEKGEKTVKQERDLYKEFASVDASVSTLPVSLIPGLSQYLERFPYGCTEQTVSKAFPAVILYGQKDLGGDAKKVEESIIHTMNRLRELQNHEGGFGYWWYGGGQANDFVSAYALHYMILAKEKHLPVPDETFRRAQDYVKTLVNRSTSSLEQARVQAYGIYLLTRSGVVTANYLPNLLHYLDTNQKDAWKQDLTAVYIAAAYKLMQLTPEANQLMNEFTLGDPVYWQAHAHYFSEYAFYNSLNRYAQYLTVVSEHFPEMLPKLDRNILFRVANFIGEGNYNTLSSSYAIMAFSAYGQASTAQTNAQLAISQQNQTGAWSPGQLTGEQIRRAKLALVKADVKFSGGGDYGLFYQIATDGYDRERPTQPIEDGLEIDRQYLDTDHNPVKEVHIGDTVNVVITMRAHDNKTLQNMAMVDLMPAGFETVPESILRPAAAAASNDNTDASANDETAANDNNDGQSEDVNEYQPAVRHHRHHHNVSQPTVEAEPSTPSPAAEDDSADYDGSPWQPQAVDVREDRVIAYGAVPSDAVVYHYKIKAVNSGTFATPPAYVESMYERSIKARGVIGTITVK